MVRVPMAMMSIDADLPVAPLEGFSVYLIEGSAVEPALAPFYRAAGFRDSLAGSCVSTAPPNEHKLR